MEDRLTALGLTESEQDAFISYWLPYLYEHDYNVISFDKSQYEEAAELEITPEPDVMIRVFMTYAGVDEFVEIPEELSKFHIPRLNDKYYAVEWGGCEGVIDPKYVNH